MALGRLFTKKRLLLLGAAVLLYAGLWFLTLRFGAGQVRAFAVAAMHGPSNYTEESQQKTNRYGGRFFWCSTRAYAPFVVYADYGWQGGALYGDGGSALYLWFFGRTVRIRELDHWESGERAKEAEPEPAANP